MVYFKELAADGSVQTIGKLQRLPDEGSGLTIIEAEEYDALLKEAQASRPEPDPAEQEPTVEEQIQAAIDAYTLELIEGGLL